VSEVLLVPGSTGSSTHQKIIEKGRLLLSYITERITIVKEANAKQQ
jgi:hypothetical protein